MQLALMVGKICTETGCMLTWHPCSSMSICRQLHLEPSVLAKHCNPYNASASLDACMAKEQPASWPAGVLVLFGLLTAGMAWSKRYKGSSLSSIRVGPVLPDLPQTSLTIACFRCQSLTQCSLSVPLLDIVISCRLSLVGGYHLSSPAALLQPSFAIKSGAHLLHNHGTSGAG